MTAISDDVAGQFRVRVVSVGTTAVQLSATERRVTRGVEIVAAAENAGDVYIGHDAALTADHSTSTGGKRLAAGDSLFVPVDDLAKIWARATQASQLLELVEV